MDLKNALMAAAIAGILTGAAAQNQLSAEDAKPGNAAASPPVTRMPARA